MSNVIEIIQAEEVTDQRPADGLFVTWFDLNGGQTPHDWWWEEPGPQPLAPALDLAAELRRDGWVAQVWPADMNPRADGRWDNP